MTEPIYLRSRALAIKNIKKYGLKVPLRRREFGEVTDRDCYVVRWEFDPRVVDGDLIMYTDHRYMMSPDIDPPPDPETEKLVIDGRELRIIKAPPLKPADLVIFYDVQARI